jgi:hypothetical protein
VFSVSEKVETLKPRIPLWKLCMEGNDVPQFGHISAVTSEDRAQNTDAKMKPFIFTKIQNIRREV